MRRRSVPRNSGDILPPLFSPSGRMSTHEGEKRLVDQKGGCEAASGLTLDGTRVSRIGVRFSTEEVHSPPEDKPLRNFKAHSLDEGVEQLEL